MADAEYPQIAFRIVDKSMHEAITRRASAWNSSNQVARRDLERFYLLLRRNTPTFSEGEAHFLLDIFNGTIFEPVEASLRLLWASVEDAEERYAEKWNVNRDELRQRLKAVSDLEAMALIDAIERFWAGQQSDGVAPTPQSVGLVAESPARNGQAS